MITQEDIDKAWEAWDKTLVARDRARNKVLVAWEAREARRVAWDRARNKALDKARELERKFKEQEKIE